VRCSGIPRTSSAHPLSPPVILRFRGGTPPADSSALFTPCFTRWIGATETLPPTELVSWAWAASPSSPLAGRQARTKQVTSAAGPRAGSVPALGLVRWVPTELLNERQNLRPNVRALIQTAIAEQARAVRSAPARWPLGPGTCAEPAGCTLPVLIGASSVGAARRHPAAHCMLPDFLRTRSSPRIDNPPATQWMRASTCVASAEDMKNPPY